LASKLDFCDFDSRNTSVLFEKRNFHKSKAPSSWQREVKEGSAKRNDKEMIYSKQKIIPKHLPSDKGEMKGVCKNYFGIIF